VCFALTLSCTPYPRPRHHPASPAGATTLNRWGVAASPPASSAHVCTQTSRSSSRSSVHTSHPRIFLLASPPTARPPQQCHPPSAPFSQHTDFHLSTTRRSLPSSSHRHQAHMGVTRCVFFHPRPPSCLLMHAPHHRPASPIRVDASPSGSEVCRVASTEARRFKRIPSQNAEHGVVRN
jgi:hypothetical protein